MQKIKDYFIRKFRNTQLTSLSLSAFSHYKKLWLIPMTSNLLFAIIIISSFMILYSLHNYAQTSWLSYGIVFLLILFLPFFATFLFQFLMMITVFLVDQYCQKGKASFFYALQKSVTKIHLIARWSIYTILFKSKYPTKEKQVSSTDSLTEYISNRPWRSFSFFIYPVFAFEDKTFFDSIKQSDNIKQTYFSTVPKSLFKFTALYLRSELILLGTIAISHILYNYYFRNYTVSQNIILFIAFIYVVISTIFLIQVIVTAETVTSVLLYRYTYNLPIGIFSRAQIEEALKEKI